MMFKPFEFGPRRELQPQYSNFFLAELVRGLPSHVLPNPVNAIIHNMIAWAVMSVMKVNIRALPHAVNVEVSVAD